MSFKRAGDDHCALRLQKKQRVTELFAEDIPAEEATQTRGGKFVCLVCPNNPVLDTMAMLAIHRQGKKHLSNMAIKIEKEHDFSELLQKRKQEVYLNEEANTSRSFHAENNHRLPRTTQKPRPLLERTRQLTQAIRGKNQVPTENRNENVGSEMVVSEKRRRTKPFFQSRVEFQLSEKLDNDFDKNQFSSTPSSGRSIGTSNAERPVCKEKQFEKSGSCAKLNQEKDGKAKNAEVRVKEKGLNKEKLRYLELRKSGWILDRSGKWVKDESVEFDSDEDEPPSFQ